LKHVAIVGSRRRTDRETVDRLIGQLPEGTVIVSGGVSGPDSWAEQAACKHGRDLRVIRPDLKGARSQGQVARRYHARYQRIVDLADEIFALVVGQRYRLISNEWLTRRP